MRYFITLLFFSSLLVLSCGEDAKKANKNAFDLGKSYLNDGNRLMEANDAIEAKKYYKKAVLEFEKEIRINPDQDKLAQMLGISQYRIRDFDNAIQWFNRAITQDNKDAVNYQYLGYALMNKSKIPEAEIAFQKAFALDKTDIIKSESIDELMEIGKLSLSLGNNFVEQGNKLRGFEFKKLGMRIMSSALQYSKYDIELAKKVEMFAVDLNDPVIIDWIRNVIESETSKTNVIEIKQ